MTRLPKYMFCAFVLVFLCIQSCDDSTGDKTEATLTDATDGADGQDIKGDADGADSADNSDSSASKDAGDATDTTDSADVTSTDGSTDNSDTSDAASSSSGVNGSDKTDATDGSNAADSATATDNVEAADVTDGTDKADATDGTESSDKTDGADGTDSSDKTDATDTTDATDNQSTCGDTLPSTAEALVTNLGTVKFDKVAVKVSHKQKPDGFENECITKMVFTLTAGANCTLEIVASKYYDLLENLVVDSIKLSAGSDCAGLPAEAQADYVNMAKSSDSHVVMGKKNVPDETQAEVCFKSFYIVKLSGEIATAAGDKSVDVSGTSMQITGDFISNALDGAECPSSWVTSPSSVGCSDGTREGFINLKKYPKIAACGGAWDVPGVHNVEPACDNKAGNDGEKSDGKGCNVSDLCSEGWHVCYGKTDVLDRNPLGCGEIMAGAQSPAFFLARTSSSGAFNCKPDSAPDGKLNQNDLFGCGDMGCPTLSQKSLGKCKAANKGCDPLNACEGCEQGKCADGSACEPGSCFPLTLGSHDTCKSLKLKPGCTCKFAGELSADDPKFKEGDQETVVCSPGSGGCGWCKPLNYWNKKLGLSLESVWNCPGSTTKEALNVVKTGVDQGGVLCCLDNVPGN